MTAARALQAALWAVCAFAAAYLLQGALRLPAVIYDPALRSIAITTSPTGLQMRYSSDLAGATLAAILAAGVRLRLPLSRFEPLGLLATALGLVALDVAFFLSRVLAGR